jgi:DNA-directed RNA polymerases I, II, and III subunit RPABC2
MSDKTTQPPKKTVKKLKKMKLKIKTPVDKPAEVKDKPEEVKDKPEEDTDDEEEPWIKYTESDESKKENENYFAINFYNGANVLWTNDEGIEQKYKVIEQPDDDDGDFVIQRNDTDGVSVEFVKGEDLKVVPPELEETKLTSSEIDSDDSDLEQSEEEEEKSPQLQKMSIEDDKYSSDDSEYSSEEEDDLNKLEKENYNDILLEYHPETKQLNYKEVLTYATIKRNEMGNIIDDLHKTIPFLSKFERAKILGLRSKQINNGSDLFVDVPSNIIDSHIIAEMELKAKKIPFIVKRPLPSGGSEYWKLQDLELLDS